MDQEGTLTNYLTPIVDFSTSFVKFFYYVFVNSVKAILPCGVLPRKSVKNNIVLITGSGSGIGRLMAIEFGKLGAHIVLWDINEYGNLETKEILDSLNIKSTAYCIDITKRKDVYATAELVKRDVGDVDILINNAGIVSGKKIFECDDEIMEKTVAVNTMSMFWTSKAFVPKMIERNTGHVVTIASLAGHAGVNGLVDYCASKHGAVGFSDALRAEMNALKKNVHVTVINPFYINTGMFQGVKTYSNFLFPILEQEYVVDRIMEAVLTNAEVLYLPKFAYVHLFCKGFLPIRSCEAFADYLGLSKCMNQFTGRCNQNNNH